MNLTSHDLVFVSDNRLRAEAMGAALVAEGAIASYVYVRSGREGEYLGSIYAEPAIVLVDVHWQLGHAELFARIRWLADELPTSRIVALGDSQSAECVAGCIESGASTFVLAQDSFGELAATIQALRGGHCRCSGTVIDVVLQRIRDLSAAKHGEAGSGEAPLTQRELEVLELVAQGLFNKEIACRLEIAVSTVKNHLHAIFEKLQVTGRRQAVRQGIASGLLGCEREQVA